MTYTSGGLIQATDYNGFVSTNTANINGVWSTAYGQPALSTVAANGTITATQWSTLNSTLTSVATHQGTAITSRSNPTAGATVTVLANLSTDITTVGTNQYNAATIGSQYTGWTGNVSKTDNTGNSTGYWTLTYTDTITFANATAANTFFNGGGLIKIQPSKTSTGQTGDTAWNTLATAAGTIYLSSTAASKSIASVSYTGTTKIGGSGTANVLATGTGFFQLTGSNVTLFKQFNTGGNSNDYILINAIYSGSTITLTTDWFSNVGTGTISGGTSASGATLGTAPTTLVTYFPPETTNLTNVWGTPTVASTVTANVGPSPVPPVAYRCSTYCTGGTFTWVAPAGVTSVSVVAVGSGAGGTGGGGGLGYKNNYTVTPSSGYTVRVGPQASAYSPTGADSYFVSCTVVKGGGGQSGTNGAGGTYTGDGGGVGGNGGGLPSGGGAGGYAGAGGNAGNGGPGVAGAGGGGGGSGLCPITSCASFRTGGGVGLWGQGVSGAGGSGTCAFGRGGSGGADGSITSGGNFGGGGGSGTFPYYGGKGAVRIIWPGCARLFPSTCVGNVAVVPGAPTIGTATAGYYGASVTFSAPADLGFPKVITYTVTSSPGNVTTVGSTSPIFASCLTPCTAYTFTVTAQNATGYGAASAASNSATPTSVYGGAQNYTTAGTYTWVAPAGITAVSAVAIGGGGGAALLGQGAGGGGGLGYRSSITVTPSSSYTVVVGAGGSGSGSGSAKNGTLSSFTGDSSVQAVGYPGQGWAGNAPGGSFVGTGGGNGGAGQYGGGGAGGYSGGGGTGAVSNGPGGCGSGGGAGGGGMAQVSPGAPNTGGGGGVGIYGAGPSGAGGSGGSPVTQAFGGGGGSGGSPGGAGYSYIGACCVPTSFGGGGGGYGGGGSGGFNNFCIPGAPGAGGAVRIVWPVPTRQYPSTNVCAAGDTAVPFAPTIGTATGGCSSASVAFTAGSPGTSAITGYRVKSSPGCFTATGSSSPITVSGLTNGTPYTFRVQATNSTGYGPYSSASNSVTPT